MAKPMTYKQAGVDIDEGNRAVSLMKKHIRTTFNSNVVTDIGSFGGMFAFDKGQCEDPILVSSADGVGTKLRLAYETGIHDTVGQDLVNHCVNDILVMGAKPLFFLDYIGTSGLVAETAEGIAKGLAKACRENGVALVGGETAELPGMYRPGEYDLASTIVGVVDRKKIIDGSAIRPGDALVGIRSSGIHTNGYSLVYRIFEKAGIGVKDHVPELGCKLHEELMKPHISYLTPVNAVMARYDIKGMAHITGGGFYDNIPRMLPKDVSAEIDRDSWPVLSIFRLMKRLGKVQDSEMFRTFNMGIGLVMAVSQDDADSIVELINRSGHAAYVIGRIRKGDRTVEFATAAP